jgi:hypothetical protein
MGVRIPARHKPATNQLQARSLNPCPQDKVIDKIRGKSTGVAPHKIGLRFARGFRERSEESLPLHLATTRGRRLAGPWGGRMGTVGVALAQAVMARGA